MKAVFTYHIHHKEYNDEYDTVDEAKAMAFYGWDAGHLYPVKITSCGIVVWDMDADGIGVLVEQFDIDTEGE